MTKTEIDAIIRKIWRLHRQRPNDVRLVGQLVDLCVELNRLTPAATATNGGAR